MKENKDVEESFGYKLGQKIGEIAVIIGMICLSAIVISLTAAFICWLF